MGGEAPISPLPLLGTALVIGGCGCVGYHLVRHLLQDPDVASVHVLDVNITRNLHSPATYHCANVSKPEAVRDIIDLVRPRVIFHCASPIANIAHRGRRADYYLTNVLGTKILLGTAGACEDVKAFVYTSTCDVYTDPPHYDIDETHTTFKENDAVNEYSRTKSIADKLVRNFNSEKLQTVVLRLGHVYGERHRQGLDEVLSTCVGSQPLLQIGSGKNRMEVISVDNAASLHILAAKALLDPTRAKGKVSGEAFNGCDSVRVPFWNHVRIVWTEVRGAEAAGKPIVIPAWIVLGIMYLVEWILWLFTLGMVKPPLALSRDGLSYCLYDHTYSSRKSKEVLGYVPVDDHDRVMAEAVRWDLEARGMQNVLYKSRNTEKRGALKLRTN